MSKCLLKVVIVSDWRRGPGRLFHSLGPAAAKLRSPSFVLVCGTTNVGTLAERSRLPLLTSLANLHLSCKYVGASPRETWYINTASLKSIRRLTGNQWSCPRTGVMCSRLLVRVSSRAAAFSDRLQLPKQGVCDATESSVAVIQAV